MALHIRGSMRLARFQRSPLGRVLEVALGVGLITAGALFGGLAGLCMMMGGMVPLVSGLFNEHPFE